MRVLSGLLVLVLLAGAWSQDFDSLEEELTERDFGSGEVNDDEVEEPVNNEARFYEPSEDEYTDDQNLAEDAEIEERDLTEDVDELEETDVVPDEDEAAEFDEEPDERELDEYEENFDTEQDIEEDNNQLDKRSEKDDAKEKKKQKDRIAAWKKLKEKIGRWRKMPGWKARVDSFRRLWWRRSFLYQITGKASTARNLRNYGCFCGGRGKGKPVDEIDSCCAERVKCMAGTRKKETKKTKKTARGRFWACRYSRKCNGKPGDATCKCIGKEGSCGRDRCDCQLAFAKCVNKNLKSYDKKNKGIRAKC